MLIWCDLNFSKCTDNVLKNEIVDYLMHSKYKLRLGTWVKAKIEGLQLHRFCAFAVGIKRKTSIFVNSIVSLIQSN